MARDTTSRPASWRLALAGSLLLCSCRSTYEPCAGDPASDLFHGDPKCRIDAAYLAAENGRLDLFPILLDNLRDPSGDVRFFTAIAVRKLSGFDAGYDSSASRFEQDEAIAKWREWWEERTRHGEEGSPAPARDLEPGETHGRAIAAPPAGVGDGRRARSAAGANPGAVSGS